MIGAHHDNTVAIVFSVVVGIFFIVVVVSALSENLLSIYNKIKRKKRR